MSWDVFFNENPGKTGGFASKIGWSLQAVNLPVKTFAQQTPFNIFPLTRISKKTQVSIKFEFLISDGSPRCLNKWFFADGCMYSTYFSPREQREINPGVGGTRDLSSLKVLLVPCKAFTGASKMLEMMGPLWWAN